jgi:protein-tyrosine phosphatase
MFTAASYGRILGANERINLGLIGCGDRGENVSSIFTGTKQIDLTAVCDIYGAKIDKLQSKNANAKGFSDHRKLLEQKNVDAVLIATGDRWHTPLSILAAQHGKDVYCEKPCSMSIEESWALAAACGWAEDAVATLRAERALRVDYVAGVTEGRLGLTLCPGRRDKGRDLSADLATLVAGGVSRVLCLVPQDELARVGVAHLRDAAVAHGLTFLHVPFPDQGVPTMAEADEAVAWVREGLAAHERVVVHCMGGLGRTGLIAACTLVTLGRTAAEAIAEVRAARGPRCVENRDQERFVEMYAR